MSNRPKVKAEQPAMTTEQILVKQAQLYKLRDRAQATIQQCNQQIVQLEQALQKKESK